VLSAIGYFAMTDKLKAGHYISVFSEFTQLTLSNADRNYILLKDELKYIETYLELEKMRFGDKFDYQIIIEENASLDLFIPTMTLHTYCDNAIRHGLVHKEGKGMLTIRVSINENGTILTILDDGIGRKRALELGTSGNGQGLKLIQAQLDFYNQMNEKSISQNIKDIPDNYGNTAGTMIELYIPIGYKFV
jgi:LytS/YehU family sensor histidine kinase